jgi:hypothetical protein
MKVKCCKCKKDITQDALNNNMNVKDKAVRKSLICQECYREIEVVRA